MSEKTLTRADIAKAITNKFKISQYNALEIIEDVLEEIAEALAKEEQVKIVGLGTFSVRQKKERIGRNPKTKEEAIISSRKSLSFKVSSILKKSLNSNQNSANIKSSAK